MIKSIQKNLPTYLEPELQKNNNLLVKLTCVGTAIGAFQLSLSTCHYSWTLPLLRLSHLISRAHQYKKGLSSLVTPLSLSCSSLSALVSLFVLGQSAYKPGF